MSFSPEQQFMLEKPGILLSFEQLRLNFKQVLRQLEHESHVMTSTLTALLQESIPIENKVKQIDGLVLRTRNLKQKMTQLKESEKIHIQRTRLRLQFINTLSRIEDLDSPEFLDWSRTRLNRLIADYMLANGYHDSAIKLCKNSDLFEMVDIDVYKRYQKILDSILRHELKEVLAWCAEHRSILKKINSTLELEIRIQRFVELIKSNKKVQAINFAKTYFGNWTKVHAVRLQQVAALLAIPYTTKASRYNEYLSDNRWDFLASLFSKTFTQVHSLSSVSILHIAIAAGLSSLKTPSCCSYEAAHTSHSFQSSTIRQCPVCTPNLSVLAQSLPYAHVTQSVIVDSLTGARLDSDNRPVAFPNGHVYGIKSLVAWNEANGIQEGYLRDPFSGKEFASELLRKVYVV
ncbi:ubiquitin ligase complex subunit [Schizosaccharomyces cryophilus OY26]|uniref:Ubiquitin ligase complex subunit n=1 Tax=Schizosaccharomyces cryophilus (strain OY26 / ATCC MYA-4695 / CBS 11777 / NBRC 106824 / NRRL Y48691) TaxID=653667 RepID=S9X1V1_SCHCR|nr:ubiquitin ligase complex subunit [Schizosaccharomyces cryophilus OY26]EPY51077.1 ubiquitin ligase complex subunit [Schizosaccharomyces cryophilus OY26]